MQEPEESEDEVEEEPAVEDQGVEGPEETFVPPQARFRIPGIISLPLGAGTLRQGARILVLIYIIATVVALALGAMALYQRLWLDGIWMVFNGLVFTLGVGFGQRMLHYIAGEDMLNRRRFIGLMEGLEIGVGLVLALSAVLLVLRNAFPFGVLMGAFLWLTIEPIALRAVRTRDNYEQYEDLEKKGKVLVKKVTRGNVGEYLVELVREDLAQIQDYIEKKDYVKARTNMESLERSTRGSIKRWAEVDRVRLEINKMIERLDDNRWEEEVEEAFQLQQSGRYTDANRILKKLRGKVRKALGKSARFK